MSGYRLPDPQWDGELRRCVLCGLLDNPIYAGYANEQGEPVFQHRVVLDITFIKPGLSAKDRSDGYLEMKLDGGRDAKVRAICLECLEQDEAAREVWKDFNRVRRETDDQSKELSFYATLCSE